MSAPVLSPRNRVGKNLPDIIIVARANRYGLSQDTNLLKETLEAAGHSVSTATPRERGFLERLAGTKRAHIAIHLERAFPAWFGAADKTWLIPNQERFPRRHLGRLKRVDRVLAKTRHGTEVFGSLGVETVHAGFTSFDRLETGSDKDWSHFFHLAGGSTLKGTEPLIALWRRHPEWPALSLLCKSAPAGPALPDNIRLIEGYVDDAALKTLQNQAGIHLCPSLSEGWGHHIVEAMSCGAVVVTTDAPPMNEHIDPSCGMLVPVSSKAQRHLGTVFHVDQDALEAAIETLIAMPQAQKAALGARARQRYETIDRTFKERMDRLFAP